VRGCDWSELGFVKWRESTVVPGYETAGELWTDGLRNVSLILETLKCDVDAMKRGRPEVKSRNPIMFINFHSRTVHLDIIKFFYLPTDAQENCSERNIKIYIKTAPTCFGLITIIEERTIRAC
jgi:hypothetical protein